jgi:hypothetical protein
LKHLTVGFLMGHETSSSMSLCRYVVMSASSFTPILSMRETWSAIKDPGARSKSRFPYVAPRAAPGPGVGRTGFLSPVLCGGRHYCHRPGGRAPTLWLPSRWAYGRNSENPSLGCPRRVVWSAGSRWLTFPLGKADVLVAPNAASLVCDSHVKLCDLNGPTA